MIRKFRIEPSQCILSTTSTKEFNSTNNLSDMELNDDFGIGDFIGTEGIEEEERSWLGYKSNGESPNKIKGQPVLFSGPTTGFYLTESGTLKRPSIIIMKMFRITDLNNFE